MGVDVVTVVLVGGELHGVVELDWAGTEDFGPDGLGEILVIV